MNNNTPKTVTLTMDYEDYTHMKNVLDTHTKYLEEYRDNIRKNGFIPRFITVKPDQMVINILDIQS